MLKKTKKIKICIMMTNLLQGGTEKQIVELIKGLNQSIFEIEVCLFAARKKLFFDEVKKIRGIKLIINNNNNKFKLMRILNVIRFIYNLLKIENYDLIYTPLFINGFIVRSLASKRYDNKLIYGIRTSYKNYKKIYKIIDRILLKKSYVVLNTQKSTKELKNETQSKYHNKIFTIKNGIQIKSNESEENHRSKLGKSGIITIGTAGRLSKEKNQIQTIRILRYIKKKPIQFVLIGDKGNASDEIHSLIKRNDSKTIVKILPKTDKMSKFYSSVDIFILNSIFEGCPNVLLEAMYHKCLCIVSKNGNSDDYIKDGENGFVYDGSDNSLIDKINKAISIQNTKKIRRIKTKARQYILRYHSMEKMINEYERLFILTYRKRIKNFPVKIDKT
jgi:glycosyltransferase involved in cell wall biosynthesis